ncbi:MAG: YlbF family regulator [Bacilli bacterium]|nr:YlbF family regulator [Bacilli bacterium]
MNQTLLEQIDTLKREIATDERLIVLNNIEKAMVENDELMRLAYKKDIAETNYNDALRHYAENASEVKEAQKHLFQAKSELEKHPLIREYLIAYREVRILYEEINDALFNPFKDHVCEVDKK